MKMPIRDIEFIGSMVRPDQWPKDGLPAVAFAGRSNVGKSSLINSILNRRSPLMRVSKTPGRTQQLNFVKVNRKFYVVDLPGYGYAKVPISLKKQFGTMIQQFLSDAAFLRAVVQILDARHAPSRDDIGLLDWLQSMQIPTILVMTKADKLSSNQLAKSRRVMQDKLGLDADAFTIFSSETGRGRDELWERINLALDATPRHSVNEDGDEDTEA